MQQANNFYRYALLSPEQMYTADNITIASGTAGKSLMQNAGSAIAQAIIKKWPQQKTVILCGTGNNGGDGFIVADLLRKNGWPVKVVLYGSKKNLKNDAAWAADLWGNELLRLDEINIDDFDLVVDGLFGAGLNRALPDDLQTLINRVNNLAIKVCAIDVPTGLDGATGQIQGAAFRADLTVTFFRPKPGHYLLPGRLFCGDLICADIGINTAVMQSIKPKVFLNAPALWLDLIRWPTISDHKYKKGHALVVGGNKLLGASRLACLAAARIGAGLVTLVVPQEVWHIQVACLTSVMVESATIGLEDNLADIRRNAILIGPGLGLSQDNKVKVINVLKSKRPCVLDADALTLFSEQPKELFNLLHSNCVLTPHTGEFSRLFETTNDKLADLKFATAKTGAVIVLKGADTAISAPDGRVVINTNAPAYLASAGTGDVLAGCILGLLANGMSAFEAACAGVWLHGRAASEIGFGLLAEDLPQQLPKSLFELKLN